MGDKTKIEWTDTTWNPIRGCSRVSAGCANCYAERVAARFSGVGMPYHGLAVLDERGPRWTGAIRLFPEQLENPIRWKRPRRIFVNSMSDLFHEGLDAGSIARIFSVMARAPRHTFQVLTKRANYMRHLLTDPLFEEEVREQAWKSKHREEIVWPLPNVWLGVSVEHQAAAQERVPHLLRSPAAVRWLSVEPMLGPVGLAPVPRLDWIVCGGESGPGARQMQAEWARDLRDECAEKMVPFFFKQWGAFDEAGKRVGKKKAGRVLEGRTWDEYPAVRP